METIAAGTATYSRIPQLKCRFRAASLKFGSISQNKSKALREDHPLAYTHHPRLVALDVTRQQQRKRNQPVEEKIERDDNAPMPANAVQIPRNLFRKIARPDDQELPEREIDIQHDKGKGELAQIVLLCLAKNGFERLGFRQG